METDDRPTLMEKGRRKPFLFSFILSILPVMALLSCGRKEEAKAGGDPAGHGAL